MKKAIELLKQLADDLSFDRPYSKEILEIVCEDTRIGILEVIELLQAPPRWETPEQYKKRTGEDWPDEAAVYIYGKRYWLGWSVCRYITAKNKKVSLYVCATEAGLPPADWKPEEAKK
jgi:hypothetical protein